MSESMILKPFFIVRFPSSTLYLYRLCRVELPFAS
jgi:hypothetical protein